MGLVRLHAVVSQVLTAGVPSYAPVNVECPSGRQLLRLAGSPVQGNQTLSQEELAFRQGRKSVTEPLWRAFFVNGPGRATGYSSTLLMRQNQRDWPVLGIAHSGGGLRAALYGAGVLQALDSRTSSSPIRGVYQLASYTTALSGGSWLLASNAASGYPAIPELVGQWQLEKDVVLPGGINIIRSGQFLDSVHDTVELKTDVGYNVSLTDLWGRALAYHFLPGTTSENFYSDSPPTAHGAGLLMSGLRQTKSVRDFQNPLPIIVSDQKPLDETEANPTNLPLPDKTYVPFSAPVYECSPFEFGSFDPQLSAFTPTEFLGTSLKSGKSYIPTSVEKSSHPDARNSCVKGFDQLSFIMGSSATLFNAATGKPGSYRAILEQRLRNITNPELHPLMARYPNPFQGVNGRIPFDRSNSNELLIVDGGENGENIPFNPLLTPVRQLDVILAADASSDSISGAVRGAGWPEGVALINTFQRIHQVLPAGTTRFPPVPLDKKVWIEKGLNTRPTFFGCNAASKEGNGGYPLIIYLPNSPLSQSKYFTNTSTFKLQYSQQETNSFLDSVMNATTKPRFESNQVDTDWPTCLSCALIERSRNRLDVKQSSICQTCFARYCYED